MIELRTPNGLRALVPETLSEDSSPRFDRRGGREFQSFFASNGYAVAANVITHDICNRVRDYWNAEVKPFRGKIYRQETARLERHRYNDRHWVMNPILNPQSVDPLHFPGFRHSVVDEIFANDNLAALKSQLLGDKPKIVQAMYFEGNSSTWEHQDSYYLDSEELGSMCGAWIALEDISPTAGRFFVCPGTHKLDWKRQNIDNNVADSHEVYVQSVVDRMKETGAEVRAPALKKGDVLFWNAFTIHGSLAGEDMLCSRSSITCHAIPAAHRFIQYQRNVRDISFEWLTDSVALHRPKDLAILKNRMAFAAEAYFPSAFHAIKRFAIKRLMNV